jgi:hypothetical protein
MTRRMSSRFLTGWVSNLLLVLLVGCNMPAPVPKTSQNPAAPTLTSQAVQAIVQTQLAPTNTLSVTTQSAVTSTPSVSQAPLATNTPTLTQTSSIDFCSDKATFKEDVTVPDGTLFSPGDKFTKTWRLQNVGTCTWTPQYKLAYFEGDKMGAQDESPFTGYVTPNSSVDLSIQLTAPGENGEYQGSWMIRSADGKLFGIGTDANKPFWVKISVAQSVSDLNLGTPTWNDTFKNSTNWYLIDTGNTQFSINNGRLVMEALSPGKAEEWGLATVSDIKNFYLEATFKTGDACSGKDRYGVLVRAPDPNSGYVFGFSCDGRYRLYKWDGTNYQGIQEWKAAGEILSGPNQTNKLGIKAVNDNIKLYANGKLLGEYTDATYAKGRFGLFIGSGETDDLTVYVEDIAYWLVNN